MSRDDDIEFDFFEEGPADADPAPAAGPRPPRPSPTGSAPPGGGRTPIGQLFVVVVFTIVILVVVGWGLEGCGTSTKGATASYMTSVAAVARASTADGNSLTKALTTSGLTLKQVKTQLEGAASREQQNVQTAKGLNPPGRLRDEHESLIEALELRVSGLSGLAKTFGEASCANATIEATDAGLLGEQAERLLASDVVWEDLFTAPTKTQLDSSNITGVNVPDSHFLTNTDLITETQMRLVLSRICGVNTGGGTTGATGVVGTNIASVGWIPGSHTLEANASSPNVISGSTGLGITVTVEDSGSEQEVSLPVTMTISSGAKKPIVKNYTIPLINPGQQITVTFKNFQPPFGDPDATLTIDVKTVPGELNVANNTATFPVNFTLPGQ